MAKNALALVRNGSKPKVEPSAPHQFRECPISEEWLFQGTDEVGREGWFLRLTISGLYPRRVGRSLARRRPWNSWRTSSTKSL